MGEGRIGRQGKRRVNTACLRGKGEVRGALGKVGRRKVREGLEVREMGSEERWCLSFFLFFLRGEAEQWLY